MKKCIATVIVGLGLTACGGGGGNPPSPPAPKPSEAQGRYIGTVKTVKNESDSPGSAGMTFGGYVLDDGTYYFVYRNKDPNDPQLGLIQGNSTSSNGSFSSSNAKEFNLVSSQVGNVTLSDARYAPKQWLKGKIIADKSTIIADSNTQKYTREFTSNYDSDYEKTPSLATLAGKFDGLTLSSLKGNKGRGMNINLTIDQAGKVTLEEAIQDANKCKATGAVSPRAHGNVYNLTLKFGGQPCPHPNQVLSGILSYSPKPKEIASETVNSSDTEMVGTVVLLPADRSSALLLGFKEPEPESD